MSTVEIKCKDHRCLEERTHPPMEIFKAVKRTSYVLVDFDTLSNNVKILRSLCKNPNVGVIGVVKAGAFMYGSAIVCKHLKSVGVERLAVATVVEGIYLRQHNIQGPIHVFGSIQPWEMETCLSHHLIPTVTTEVAILGMHNALQKKDLISKVESQEDTRVCSWCCCRKTTTTDTKRVNTAVERGAVHIMVDTGLNRNGCTPEELPAIVKKCEELGVPLEGIFSQFSESWGHPKVTQSQLNTFLKCVRPYRNKVLVHIANSGAILRGAVGTDLDFVRPGCALWGLPPGETYDTQPLASLGIRPVASVKAIPSLVKHLPKGRKVGYAGTYELVEDQWIATFMLGYADGYWRALSNNGVIVNDATGERCPVVGRISMDSFTAKLSCQPGSVETFTVITADYDANTSAAGIACKVGTTVQEVATRLSTRLPRIYLSGGIMTIVQALGVDIY